MKHIHTFLLAAALGLSAVVGSGQAPQSPKARDAQTQATGAKHTPSTISPPDAPVAAPAQPVSQTSPADTAVAPPAQGAPLVVGVVDTSPSMRKFLEAARHTATEFIKRAPPQAAVALVGINNEADKSPIYTPERRAEAVEFIARLTVGGRFTDLSRGTDAALALLQEASPSQAVVVYFTDGQLQVPSSFKHRQSFVDLLRKEFGERRGNVHVIVVNFGGKTTAATPDMPPNVKVIPVGSDSELQQALENVLTPALTQHLSTPPALVAPPPVSPPAIIEPQRSRAGPFLLVGLILFFALGAAAFLVRRKRMRQTQKAQGAGPDDGHEEPIENILQQGDLLGQAEEVVAEPVALLDIRRLDAQHDGARFSRRESLRVAEAVIVGGSEFAGIHLPGLIQPETLRLSYDGSICRVARLRPRLSGKLDAVNFNGEPAPIQFQLAPGDELVVGDFVVSLLLVSEYSAALVEPSANTMGEALSLRPVRNRRLLRAATAKGNYDART